ncbi:MAG: RSP_7527 family protein [Tropicimonas sp.]|uniref:RSP_7527 family protein n=1 Tax=Tropicimonas sp. TaxID=2067044 RepID=UPI003A88E87C
MEKQNFIFAQDAEIIEAVKRFDPEAVRKLEREAEQMRAAFIKDCFRAFWRSTSAIFRSGGKAAGRTA